MKKTGSDGKIWKEGKFLSANKKVIHSQYWPKVLGTSKEILLSKDTFKNNYISNETRNISVNRKLRSNRNQHQHLILAAFAFTTMLNLTVTMPCSVLYKLAGMFVKGPLRTWHSSSGVFWCCTWFGFCRYNTRQSQLCLYLTCIHLYVTFFNEQKIV